MASSKIFVNIRILRNSIIYDMCSFVSCNRSTMVYDKCRLMPSNVAFFNFMTDLYIRKPQGDSVMEPPCGFVISSCFASAVTSMHWRSFGHFLRIFFYTEEDYLTVSEGCLLLANRCPFSNSPSATLFSI